MNEQPANAPMPRAALGVLLVHGIGRQKQGTTLTKWVERVREWLAGWRAAPGDGPAGGDVSLGETELKPGPALPAHTTLKVAGSEWLFAESSWGDVYDPPAAGVVGAWAVTFGPRVISQYTQRRIAPVSHMLSAAADEDALGTGGLLGAYVSMWFLFFVFVPLWAIWVGFFAVAALVANLVLFALVALVLPLGSVFPPLRKLATRAALIFSDVLGDTYLLERSPVTRAAMVSRLQRDIGWLEERCDRIVVAAHSQGSVLAFEALHEKPRATVARLVTAGSALRMLSSLPDDEDHEQAIDEHIVLPGIAWTDFYASADPVPDGPLWRARPPSGAESVRIASSGSVFTDHVSYLKNLDGFVGPLSVRLEADAAGVAGPPAADSEALERAGEQRARRVRRLMVARFGIALSTLAAIPLLGSDALRQASKPLDHFVHAVRPKWITPTGHVGTGALTVALAGIVLYLVALAVWRAWNKAALSGVYRRAQKPTGGGGALALLAVSCVGPATDIVIVSLGVFGWPVWGAAAAVVGFGCLVVVIERLFRRFAGRPTMPDPPRAEELSIGTELAYREGSAIRHVQIVPHEPESSQLVMMVEFLGAFAAGGTINTVEMLDDPVRSGGAPKGSRHVVRGRGRFVSTWVAYTEWKTALDRWRAQRRE